MGSGEAHHDVDAEGRNEAADDRAAQPRRRTLDTAADKGRQAAAEHQRGRKAEGIEMLAVVAEAEDAVAAARCQKQAKCKLRQDENAFRHVCDAFVQLRHVPCSLRSF